MSTGYAPEEPSTLLVDVDMTYISGVSDLSAHSLLDSIDYTRKFKGKGGAFF